MRRPAPRPMLIRAMTRRPTRTPSPRAAPRRTAAGTLVVAVLLVLATGAPAARATGRPMTSASASTATVVAGASVLVAQADEGTSTDDTKAGSGQNAPGDPPAWRGPLAFIGWILVAAGAFGFLIWIVFGRALLRSSDGDDGSPAEAADASPPDAAPQ
jgi:hypothetical protein